MRARHEKGKNNIPTGHNHSSGIVCPTPENLFNNSMLMGHCHVMSQIFYVFCGVRR